MLRKDYDDFKTRTIFKLEHIKQLIEVCLFKAYFLCDNQIHCLESSPAQRLKQSVASSGSVIIWDIYRFQQGLAAKGEKVA